MYKRPNISAKVQSSLGDPRVSQVTAKKGVKLRSTGGLGGASSWLRSGLTRLKTVKDDPRVKISKAVFQSSFVVIGSLSGPANVAKFAANGLGITDESGRVKMLKEHPVPIIKLAFQDIKRTTEIRRRKMSDEIRSGDRNRQLRTKVRMVKGDGRKR